MGDKQFYRQKWTRYLGELRPIHDIEVNWIPFVTPSITPTLTPTPSVTPSVTPTSSPNPTPSVTPTLTSTPYFSCLRVWYDSSNLSSLIRDTNNYVSQWNDLGPYSYDLIQSNSSEQPKYQEETLNPQVNFSAVTFDGFQYMSISGLSFTDTGYTYIVVGGINRNEQNGFVFSFDGPSISDGANYYLQGENTGGGTDKITLGADNTKWNVTLQGNSGDTLSRSSGLYLGVVTGITNSSSYAELNDILLTAFTTANTSNTITQISVGSESGATSTLRVIGELMELRVFDCVLSKALLDFHVNEMKSKWDYSNWLITPTPTPSVTPGLSPTPTPSFSPTPNVTNTPSVSPTNSSTPVVSPTTSPTVTPTPSSTTPCTCNVQVDNNATGIDITDVQFNTTSVTYSSGDDFPVQPTELGNFTTTVIGTSITVDVYYGSHTGNKSINLTDCDNNSYCIDGLNTAGGYAQFAGIVVECACTISITITNGDCL